MFHPGDGEIVTRHTVLSGEDDSLRRLAIREKILMISGEDDLREFIFPNEGDDHRCANDEEEIVYPTVMTIHDDGTER